MCLDGDGKRKTTTGAAIVDLGCDCVGLGGIGGVVDHDVGSE